MQTSRRALMVASLPLAALASGCATTGPLTDAQVLADAAGIVNGLLAVIPTVPAAVLASAIGAKITSGLKLAQTAIGSLSASTPSAASASTLVRVEGDINEALDALAVVTPAAASAFPVLGPAVPIIAAAKALLPVVEAFVNSYVVAPVATASLRAAAEVPDITVAAARATLGIPVVR